MARWSLSPSVLELEDAIVAALADDGTGLGAYAKDVRSWQGDLEEALGEAVRRTPLVLVVFTGLELPDEGASSKRGVSEWLVMVAARNLRGERARRAGATASEPGAYDMVTDAIAALEDQTFSLDGLEPLRLRAVELIKAGTGAGRSLVAYGLTFTAHMDLVASEGDVLDTIEATYNVVHDDPDGETVETTVATNNYEVEP